MEGMAVSSSPSSTSSTPLPLVFDELLLHDELTEEQILNLTGGAGLPETCFFRRTNESFLICFAFFIIFALSVIGNALVIAVILRQRGMRSITNTYLLNLAMTDLMLSAICMPPTLVSMVINCWMFGNLMCKLFAYLQPVVVTASAYTLAVIAFERYYAICRPLHSRIWQTRRHAYWMIFLVWVVALLSNIGVPFMYEMRPYNMNGLTCTQIHSPLVHFGYQVYMTVVLLGIPLTVMTVLYGAVIHTLRSGILMDIAAVETTALTREISVADCNALVPDVVDSPRSRKSSLVSSLVTKLTASATPANGAGTARGSLAYSAPAMTAQSIRSTHTVKSAMAKQRVIRMLLVVVVIFFCCWTPSYIFWLLVVAGDVFEGGPRVWNPDVNTFITVLTYLSSCTNPITYCFMNKKFRTAMLAMFGWNSGSNGKRGPVPPAGCPSASRSNKNLQKLYLPVNGGVYSRPINRKWSCRLTSTSCSMRNGLSSGMGGAGKRESLAAMAGAATPRDSERPSLRRASSSFSFYSKRAWEGRLSCGGGDGHGDGLSITVSPSLPAKAGRLSCGQDTFI